SSAIVLLPIFSSSSFFTSPAPPESHTLSLHDALPISGIAAASVAVSAPAAAAVAVAGAVSVAVPVSDEAPSSDGAVSGWTAGARSEEHTSELQSRFDLVCRLLLEKKKYGNTKADDSAE